MEWHRAQGPGVDLIGYQTRTGVVVRARDDAHAPTRRSLTVLIHTATELNI
ncbi:hypothetical protein J2T55_002557 [Methylohalomonas lacus]|uniref:Uncharacterized protein n=1 Tax=Methylohalomonas lacus TaxID=398773 RepID=A0AAE3HN73_9GAMM|nr:hypothetical protein [Methylohalomonas lacus]